LFFFQSAFPALSVLLFLLFFRQITVRNNKAIHFPIHITPLVSFFFFRVLHGTTCLIFKKTVDIHGGVCVVYQLRYAFEIFEIILTDVRYDLLGKEKIPLKYTCYEKTLLF